MPEEPIDFDRAYHEQVDSPNPVLYVLSHYGGRYRRLMLLGLATTAAEPLLNLVPPYLLGTAIDAVVGGPAAFRMPFVPEGWVPGNLEGQLFLTFGLIAATAIALMGIKTADTLTWARLQYDVAHDLRTETYDAAQHHSMGFFTRAQTGDVMNVLNEDVESIKDIFGGWFTTAFQFFVFGTGMALVMIAMNWQLAAVAMVFAIPMGVISYFFHRRVSSKYSELRRAGGQLNTRLETGIDGVSTVKAYANEPYEQGRMERYSQSFHDKGLDIHFDWAYWAGGIRFLKEAAALAVLLVGGWLVLHGPPTAMFTSISVGVFVTFFFYARQFVDRLKRIGDIIRNYDDVAAVGRRVLGLIHYPLDVVEAEDAVDLERVSGAVRFEEVTFSYPGTSEPAVQDVSFVAEPGQFIGLVGQTGAGKSTVYKLLFRFYDLETGTITLDGHDVRDLRIRDLRGAIGYVEQEPFLFDDTVRNNLTYANPRVTEAEVIAAAKRARAHGFVTELPDGYDTEIGERGVKLSGGERQRLVIARALLEDPDILILDEATSHVDNETELLIQNALEDLIANRTTIAIAHRLSTVMSADQLLVMEDGGIVERGTHGSLLDADGAYAALWNSHIGKQEASPR